MRNDQLTLFKMLVLQQLFNLSDEELEFQVNVRRSFQEFVGLGVMNTIPDAATFRKPTSTPEHALAPETPMAKPKCLCQASVSSRRFVSKVAGVFPGLSPPWLSS